MKVSVYNNQKDLTISKSCIAKQVTAILDNEKIECSEVIIHFVEKKEIIKLHKKYFNDPSFTDCISFPIDKPDKNCIILGEIFICTKAALEYSEKNGCDPFDEASLYIIHGLLHLIGYDDILKKDRTVMKKKEKECMSLLKKRNLGINTKHTKKLMSRSL